MADNSPPDQPDVFDLLAEPASIEEAQTWIGYYARFWKAQFDVVETHLKQSKTKSLGEDTI